MASEHYASPPPFDSTDLDSVITESRVTRSLEEVAAQIVVLATQEDDVVLQNALHAAELKKRVLAGEAGKGVKWMEWMLRHVDMSESHLYALVEIGCDSDPLEALERWRRKARQRSKQRVISSDLSDNHRNMIKLVRKLTDHEAKVEYLALWKRYGARI